MYISDLPLEVDAKMLIKCCINIFTPFNLVKEELNIGTVNAPVFGPLLKFNDKLKILRNELGKFSQR